MRLPAFLQPRILKQAAKALTTAPFTTKFPREPFEPVASFRGRPRFDASQCIGCGACAEVCPAKCIEVIDDLATTPPTRRLTQHVAACIWCGQCERYCPTGEGIRMTNEYACVGFSAEGAEETVEKELALCEVCGQAAAPLDQLRWLAARLGILTFANPTLMSLRGHELGVMAAGVASEDGHVLRTDRVALQCPRCRRKTAAVA